MKCAPVAAAVLADVHMRPRGPWSSRVLCFLVQRLFFWGRNHLQWPSNESNVRRKTEERAIPKDLLDTLAVEEQQLPTGAQPLGGDETVKKY